MNRSQGYYPLIEEYVIEFLNTYRSLQFPITKNVILLQAERVRDKILPSNTLDSDTNLKIKPFRASAGWCSRYTTSIE